MIVLNSGVIGRRIDISIKRIPLVGQRPRRSEVDGRSLKFPSDLQEMLAGYLTRQGTFEHKSIRRLLKPAEIDPGEERPIFITAKAYARSCIIVPRVVEIIQDPVVIIEIILANA